jgi:hypothetical protein
MLMRLLYLDEAGFSNPAQEPYSVVGGVLLHGNRDIKRVEERLRIIARKFQPENPDVIFHAKDIFHGTKEWHRDKFPREQRLQILTELCGISSEFDFQVVMGIVKRSHYDNSHPGMDTETGIYVTSAIQCIMTADTYLRRNVSDFELAMVIAEDRHNVKRHMREMQRYLQSDESKEIDKKCPPDIRPALDVFAPLPLQRIVDTVHYAAKDESSLLQLADVTCFAIKRRLMDCPYAEEMCRPMYAQMSVFPAKWPPILDKRRSVSAEEQK